MTQERPRLMDWACLILLGALALAPAVDRIGVWREEVGIILGFFPNGFLLAGLVLAVIKSALRLDLSFGLSGGRWATLLAILSAAGIYYFTVSVLSTPQILSFPAVASRHGSAMTLPGLLATPFTGLMSAITALALIYAFLIVFSGRKLGPARRRAHLPK